MREKGKGFGYKSQTHDQKRFITISKWQLISMSQ